MRNVLPRSGVRPDSITSWVSLSAQRTGLPGDGISAAAPAGVVLSPPSPPQAPARPGAASPASVALSRERRATGKRAFGGGEGTGSGLNRIPPLGSRSLLPVVTVA